MGLSKTPSPWAGLIHGGPRFKASASFSNTQAEHLGAPSRSQRLLAPARRAPHPCPPPLPRVPGCPDCTPWCSISLHVKQREPSGRAAKCFLGCPVLNSRHGRCGPQQQLDGPSLWPQTRLHSCRLHHPLPGPAILHPEGRQRGYKGDKCSQK